MRAIVLGLMLAAGCSTVAGDRDDAAVPVEAATDASTGDAADAADSADAVDAREACAPRDAKIAQCERDDAGPLAECECGTLAENGNAWFCCR